MDSIKTKKEAYLFSSLETVLSDIQSYGFCIIYRTDKVEILKTEDVKDLNNLLEIRAFNSNGELRLTKVNGGFAGRIVTDGAGSDTEIFDENHLLWGKPEDKAGVTAGYTFLQEDRGTKLTVPIEVKKNQRAFVKVRNYLSSAKDAFEFDDFRMVELFAQEAKEYGKE